MKRPIYSAFLLLAVGLICAVSAVAKEKPLSDKAVFDAMKKATTFMVEKVSNNGGYLWNYAPDFSRVWGELECKPSMMWIERGTPAMGNVFLDAYHATGDEYYFKAAEAAAGAIVWAQLPCGGWNYMADFAGEASLKDWYETVAKGYTYCAQEHLHYSGNATYDDGTIDAAGFLLRMYKETMDPKYRPAIEKAIDFMIESQYPVEEAVKDSPFIGKGAKQREYPEFYSGGSGRKEDAAVVKALVDQLKEKDYWPGKLPGVSRENPGFSDAPLPSEVISTWNYVQNMTRLINYITVR